MTKDIRKMIIDAVYGEGANASPEVKAMIASTILNRMSANRPKEFGKDVEEILQKGYYAVKNPNEPYKEAVSGKFLSELSKRAYQESSDIVDNLMSGKTPKHQALFYFKPPEEIPLRKNPKKFNFDYVKPLGQVGEYNVYTY